MNVAPIARRTPVWVVVCAAALLAFALLTGCGGSPTPTAPAGSVATTSGAATRGGGTGSTASGATGSTTAGAAGGQTITVVMTNRAYDPQQVTLKVGDTVTWVNQDAPQHDVVANNGEFKSQLFDKGQSFSYTFTKAGTYPYHCSIHPGMTGTVIVQ
jgi:plastocyanin